MPAETLTVRRGIPASTVIVNSTIAIVVTPTNGVSLGIAKPIHV